MTLTDASSVPPAVAAVIAAHVLTALADRVSTDEANAIGHGAVEALRTDGWSVSAHRGRRLSQAAPALWEYDLSMLAGLARGSTGEEIATATSTPYATVRQRLRRLRARTGAANSAELVAIAYQAGWMDELPPEARGPIHVSPIEARALELLAYGRTNPQIAEELGVTTGTAVMYLRRLYDALDAARPGHPDHSSRCRAVALGYQHGLLIRPAIRHAAPADRGAA